jgi:hypothetical protein
MSPKNVLMFGGLALLIACTASWLAVAQADIFRCDYQAVVVCGPNWSSPFCPGANPLCENLDAEEDNHYLCYPFITGGPCNGYTCMGRCAAGGAVCDTFHQYHCR